MTITLSKKATLSKKHNTKKRRIKSLTKHNKHDKPPSPRLENERRVHEILYHFSKSKSTHINCKGSRHLGINSEEPKEKINKSISL